MKKVTIIMLSLLFVFFTVSCKENRSDNIELGNSICFALDIKENGGVKQTMSFPLQITELEIGGEEEYIKELALEIKTKLFLPIFLNLYTTNMQNGMKFKIGEDLIYEEPVLNEKNQTIQFSFEFVSSEVWNYFHSDNGEKDTLKRERGFFFDKHFAESEMIFAQKLTIDDKTQTYGEYLLKMLSTIQSKYSEKNASTPSFMYCYNHFSTKLRTNADHVVHTEEGVQNIWLSSLEDLNEGKNVEIYVLQVNRSMWYLVSLCAICLIMGVIALLNRFKKRVREKN